MYTIYTYAHMKRIDTYGFDSIYIYVTQYKIVYSIVIIVFGMAIVVMKGSEYILYCAMCIVHYVQCTVYSEPCSMYTVQTVYHLHCTL